MEKLKTRKMLFVSCGLLLFMGTFACALLKGQAPPSVEPVKFTGSAGFTSEPFDINTNEWQINWEMKVIEGKRPNFVLFVYPEGDKANWIEMVKTPLFDANGSTYIYKGKGRYYIKVNTQNIANWQVEVVRAGVGKPMTSPATFSGSADTTTKPFKIRGKEFKIAYAVESPTYAGQSIAVYSRGETENYIDMITVGAGTGTKLLKGRGEYYIKIQCPGVKSWKIDVTE
jgi:hypothetical protein